MAGGKKTGMDWKIDFRGKGIDSLEISVTLLNFNIKTKRFRKSWHFLHVISYLAARTTPDQRVEVL